MFRDGWTWAACWGLSLAILLMARPVYSDDISKPRQPDAQTPSQRSVSVNTPAPRPPRTASKAKEGSSSITAAPEKAVAKSVATAGSQSSAKATDETAKTTAKTTATTKTAKPSDTSTSAEKDKTKSTVAVAKPAEVPASSSTTSAPSVTGRKSEEPSGAKTDVSKVGGASEDETAAPAPVPAGPVVMAVRSKLSDGELVRKVHKDDAAAIVAFYAARREPVWLLSNGAFSSKAESSLEEVKKADDWGLEASAFDLPSLSGGSASTDELAEADVKLTLALLKYARHAKGGRVDPKRLSRILDAERPFKDPNVVLRDIAATDAPAIYLRGLHPQHEQFERLRQALLKTRGGATEKPKPLTDAQKVQLPRGPTLKLGAKHKHVALLRKRLEVPPVEGAEETKYDSYVADAVKKFQKSKKLAPSGALTRATRRALNAEGRPKKKVSRRGREQRILINMERWRWLPDDMGDVHVWDNIPEFMARVMSGNKEVFKEKMIVGLPEWATPVFSADMKYIIFNPSWGVPDGIKRRELKPRLKSAGSGFLFFGGGGASVLRAYGLKAYRNGKPVDIDSVNWASADLRKYSFIQPPGGKNPLGIVKFRFPNKHAVYMHDTIERHLFSKSRRALSHGCMRVEHPKKLAAVLLSEGQGWSREKVSRAIRGGGSITLDKPIPVYVTYFTARVDDGGRVRTYGDIYGHDGRLSAALNGRRLRLAPAIETASSEDGDLPVSQAQRKKKRAYKKKKSTSNYSHPSNLADAINGLLTN
jgi:L,D-transpeptidase YcbB